MLGLFLIIIRVAHPNVNQSFLHYTDCVPPFKSIFLFHSPFVSSSRNPENLYPGDLLTSEAKEALEAQLAFGL